MPNSLSPLTRNWISSEKRRNTSNSFLSRKKKKMRSDPTPMSQKETALRYYQAMKTQRKFSPHKTMRTCGLSIARNIPNEVRNLPSGKEKTLMIDSCLRGAEIKCTLSKHGVATSGLCFCQSPFCVGCMGYQRKQRRILIEKGLEQATRNDFSSYFVTLTIKRTNNIKTQVKDLFDGWKVLQHRLKYRLDKQGIQAFFVRNLDITFKPDTNHVYHTHLHCIVILDKPLKKYKDRTLKREISTFKDFLQYHWVDLQRKKGSTCSLLGQHIEEVEDNARLSRYVSKFEGLAMELTYFAHKKGKITKLDRSSIGFMELLGFVKEGDKKCTKIYQDFLVAMKNCRTVSFSQNWTNSRTKEEEEDLLYLDMPFVEREEEKEEEETVEVIISQQWFMILRYTWDKFLLCLQYAFIEGVLQDVYHWLNQYPEEYHVKMLYQHFRLDYI